MEFIKQGEYNLIYYNCGYLIDSIFKQITDFNIDQLNKRDLHKLILHFLILSFLKINKTKKDKEKSVFFFYKEEILSEDSLYIKTFSESIKRVKNILPLPVIIIEDKDIFIKNNGYLKEINSINYNFYHKKNYNTTKLVKYLKQESFFDLCNMLKCINNIKSLSY